MENPTIIGQSAVMENILRSVGIISATGVNVLLLGESGTGKELLARSIHHQSPRSKQRYITVNCAALPEELAEAELFGYRKGAFTGAESAHTGFIRQADGGTLFLDEIGELSPKLQAKLLRFLESGECQTIGSDRQTMVDVRVIAATNRDLLQEVKAGRFRQDLYFRLNIVPVELPPLRERYGDITTLLQHFICLLSQQYKVIPPALDKSTLSLLEEYHWPGNIRELRNLCQRLVILLQGQTIHPENLPAEVRLTGGLPVTQNSFVLPEKGISLERLEQDMISQALDKTAGNRSRAAKLLGLTRDTLLYRMKKYAMR